MKKICIFWVLLTITIVHIKGQENIIQNDEIKEIQEKPQNDAEIQYQLGLMYLNGLQERQNFEKIQALLEKMDDKDIKKQFFLGIMFCYALGKKKDFSKAKIYFEKAAQQGLKEHNLL